MQFVSHNRQYAPRPLAARYGSAAAGMTAIFGTPLAALFIAIELLLFEFSARSFIPVLIGVSTAYAFRLATGQTDPEFPIANVTEVITSGNMVFYFFASLRTVMMV